MVKLFITLQTLDSNNSIIVIDISVYPTGFTDSELCDLGRFLCGIFFLEDHLDIHGQGVLRKVEVLEGVVALMVGTPAIEALEAHVHTGRGFLYNIIRVNIDYC
jgi:hypothetical protein